MMQALLGIIRGDQEFRERIVLMGGYGVADMGRVIAVLG
jgi:hypothetical protein